MPHRIVKGVVTHIERGSETSGAGSSYRGTGRMQVSTDQRLIIRIDGQAAELKSKSMFQIKEGETVLAAGTDKQGTLRIGAIRNLSGGNYYYPPITLVWVAAALSLLVGLPFSLILLGLPFLVLGIYLILVALSWGKSVKMVEEAYRQGRQASTPAAA
jgi:hypothetical protein